MRPENIFLKNKDRIIFNEKCMVYLMGATRDVVSTSPLNGGSSQHLNAIFNFDETPKDGGWCQMKAKTYKEHLAIIAGEISLDPYTTTALSTTVDIDNTVVLKELYHGHEIVVICTAGLDINATRAGEPAGYDEWITEPDIHKGTVNIICSCDVSLPAGSLSRMILTVTEAKTAAIQELMVGSCFSDGLATGSGTDGVVVISNPHSNVELTNVGAHSKLGEIISQLTKNAVKSALYKQTGLDELRQRDVFERLKRFDINGTMLSIDEKTCKDETQVAIVSMIVHLLDQMSWGVLNPEGVINASQKVLGQELEISDVDKLCSSKVRERVLRGVVQYLVELETQ